MKQLIRLTLSLLFSTLSLTIQAEDWSSLNADQQKILSHFENSWDTLAPEQQQKLSQGAER